MSETVIKVEGVHLSFPLVNLEPGGVKEAFLHFALGRDGDGAGDTLRAVLLPDEKLHSVPALPDGNAERPDLAYERPAHLAGCVGT